MRTLIIIVLATFALAFGVAFHNPTPTTQPASSADHTTPTDITHYPCWTNYSITCTRDQYQNIARWNCDQIRAAGDSCEIKDPNSDQPYATRVLNSTERAQQRQWVTDSIHDNQAEGYVCTDTSDPTHDSYGYSCQDPNAN